MIPGDRIEVVFSDGTIHATGVLVAMVGTERCVYLDPGYGEKHWPGSFRHDQVRPERSAPARLAPVIKQMEERLEGIRVIRARRLFNRKRPSAEEIALVTTLESLRAVREALRPIGPVATNCGDEIITETASGLKRGDPVVVHLPREDSVPFQATFIAEFRGMRWFRYYYGQCGAQPIERVCRARRTA